MIIIVDSGATKADWTAIQADGKQLLRTKTTGLNPDLINAEGIAKTLAENSDLQAVKNRVGHIFFYGAGCDRPSSKSIVDKALRGFFKEAAVTVHHDLTAAAYAVYHTAPVIACILGTGSNACYFDGRKIKADIHSLFYILGDEGSGNHIGKRLLQAYFSQKMPPRIGAAFKARYELTIDKLYEKVYHSPSPNVYLASFSRFASDYKAEPFIQNILYQCFMAFFVDRVLPYRQATTCAISFIGSVAYHYEEVLHAVAAQLHLRVGTVVKQPIDKLVAYHVKHLIPNLKSN